MEKEISRKSIFLSAWKSKIGYSFTYKDLNEFETIIDFYEQQCKKQKEVIDKATEWVRDWTHGKNDWFEEDSKPSELLDILKEK